MIIIRQLKYVGSESALRKMLARSLPDGVMEVSDMTLDVRTVRSDLPELPPHVEDV